MYQWHCIKFKINEQRSCNPAQNAQDVYMHAKTSLFDPWTHGTSAPSLMEPHRQQLTKFAQFYLKNLNEKF